MSGFAGFVGRGSAAGDRERVLSAMGAGLARRGEPTDSYLDDDIAVVCRRSGQGGRLIRDGGPSSLLLMDGPSDPRLHAVVGPAGSPAEIEVGLAGLTGGFALLAWEGKAQRLLLARDRLGQRPLYYYEGPELLAFASEPKLLLAHPDCPREVDWRGGADVMDVGATFFGGLRAVPGGEYAVWNRGQALRLRSYAPAPVPGPGGEGQGDLVADFLGVLAENVRSSTLDSKVIAISAEGGVASALILSAAAKARGPALDSLWILDPKGRGARLDTWRSLPQSLGLSARVLTADDLEVPEELHFSLEGLERLVRAADEPFLDLRTILRAESQGRLHGASAAAQVVTATGAVDLFPSGAPSRARMTEAAMAHAGVPNAFRPFMGEAFRPGWEWSAWTDRQSDLLIRSRELQRRLPVEARIAEALGVEVQAPFLDDRLLDLAYRATRAPTASPRGLLWDLAERVLPPASRRALERFEGCADEEGAALMLGRRILDGVFPEFLDAYCGRPDSMFSPDRIGQVYKAARRARLGSVLGARLIAGLLEGVTAAIFARHVEKA